MKNFLTKYNLLNFFILVFFTFKIAVFVYDCFYQDASKIEISTLFDDVEEEYEDDLESETENEFEFEKLEFLPLTFQVTTTSFKNQSNKIHSLDSTRIQKLYLDFTTPPPRLI